MIQLCDDLWLKIMDSFYQNCPTFVSLSETCQRLNRLCKYLIEIDKGFKSRCLRMHHSLAQRSDECLSCERCICFNIDLGIGLVQKPELIDKQLHVILSSAWLLCNRFVFDANESMINFFGPDAQRYLIYNSSNGFILLNLEGQTCYISISSESICDVRLHMYDIEPKTMKYFCNASTFDFVENTPQSKALNVQKGSYLVKSTQKVMRINKCVQIWPIPIKFHQTIFYDPTLKNFDQGPFLLYWLYENIMMIIDSNTGQKFINMKWNLCSVFKLNQRQTRFFFISRKGHESDQQNLFLYYKRKLYKVLFDFKSMHFDLSFVCKSESHPIYDPIDGLVIDFGTKVIKSRFIFPASYNNN